MLCIESRDCFAASVQPKSLTCSEWQIIGFLVQVNLILLFRGVVSLKLLRLKFSFRLGADRFVVHLAA